MIEQYAILAAVAAVAAIATARWLGSLAKAKKNKRPNQDLQPLLGVVWPEEVKSKKKRKDKN